MKSDKEIYAEYSGSVHYAVAFNSCNKLILRVIPVKKEKRHQEDDYRYYWEEIFNDNEEYDGWQFDITEKDGTVGIFKNRKDAEEALMLLQKFKQIIIGAVS